MKLKLYLIANRITIIDFSNKIDCSRVYLTNVVNGKKKPGKRLAKDIEIATNGEVTVFDLLNG